MSAPSFTTASEQQGKDFIRQLLEAEKSAKQSLERAVQDRKAKLKSAKEKAEQDLKVFRDEQQKKFEKETASKKDFDAMKEMSNSTKAEIEMVQRDYDSNKTRTVKYIVDKILDVPITLTDTQMQSLKAGTV